MRKGNPKNLHTWADLVKPGVQIVQPNPISSGGARWDAMAAYGQALAQGKTPAQALTYLNAYFKNIVAQDKSARDALNTFLSGKGDVLVGYESEALPAIAAGNPVDIVRPSYTLLIQNPIAVTGSSQNPTQAKAFVQFLLRLRRRRSGRRTATGPSTRPSSRSSRRASRRRTGSSRSPSSGSAAGRP